MTRYLVERAAAMIAVVVAASIAVFVALSLVPGDPAALILGQDATPEGIRQLRLQLGLDRPLWTQYADFAGNALRGDLGISYSQQRPVVEELARAFPVTLILSTVAMALSIAIGVTVGVLAALRANTWIDNVLRVVLLASTSMPIFFLGLLFIYLFAVELTVLPSFGWGTPAHVILPAVTLAAFPLALIGRITRASMLDVVAQEYVTTARSKGLRESVIVLRHEARNAAIPVVTVISLQFGVLLAGAILTETIFSVPGMGQLLINAVFARDYPVIRGVVLLAAVAVTTINFAVDLVYLAIDPRIRYR